MTQVKLELFRPCNSANQPILNSGQGHLILRRKVARKDFPFKVTQYDPDTKQHVIITSKKTFAEAYAYPGGTHVVQTHGNAQQLGSDGCWDELVGRVKSGINMARRAVGGYLIAGPMGAAIGAMIGKHDKVYRLPHFVVTAFGLAAGRKPCVWMSPCHSVFLARNENPRKSNDWLGKSPRRFASLQ